MGGLRTTILIDEFVASRVRQLFHGNLSKGINVLLREHMSETEDGKMFGVLKGRVSVKHLKEIDKEDEEAERRDPLLRS